MKKAKPFPSIVVCYYDMEEIERQNPKELAQRCCGEIVVLCRHIGDLTELLIDATRKKDIADAVRLCELYYEDAIMRIYSLRDRAFDTLGALVGIPRNKKRFRDEVLAELEIKQPELKKVFDTLIKLIDTDLKHRNVTTHQTLIFLGVSFTDDFSDISEVGSMLLWSDPDSNEGQALQATVRKALKSFVTQKNKHLKEIISQAHEFAQLSREAIDKKAW